MNLKTDNTNQFKKTSDIANKLIDASFNHIEDSELDEFLSDEYTRNRLKERFNNAEDAEERMIQILNQDRVADIDRMKAKIHKLEINKRLKFRRRLFSAIAVAGALMFISFQIWSRRNSYEPRLITYESKNVTVPTLLIEGEKSLDLNNDTILRSENFSKVGSDKLKYVALQNAATTEQKVIYNTLIVPSGYTYCVELSDGTQITVNAGGELKYPTIFKGERREVELKGEAYFDVTKSEKPFIVKTGESEVKVYGTQFNVNYNQQMNFIEAVLIEGSIGFKNETGEMMLKPNERILYDYQNNITTISEINLENYISWKDGAFKYKDENLVRVLNDISNWYGVKFNLKKDMSDMIITIDINKGKPVDDIIYFIGLILNTEIVKEERGVYSIE